MWSVSASSLILCRCGGTKLTILQLNIVPWNTFSALAFIFFFKMAAKLPWALFSCQVWDFRLGCVTKRYGKTKKHRPSHCWSRVNGLFKSDSIKWEILLKVTEVKENYSYITFRSSISSLQGRQKELSTKKRLVDSKGIEQWKFCNHVISKLTPFLLLNTKYILSI